jgi:hypothetical protein
MENINQTQAPLGTSEEDYAKKREAVELNNDLSSRIRNTAGPSLSLEEITGTAAPVTEGGPSEGEAPTLASPEPPKESPEGEGPPPEPTAPASSTEFPEAAGARYSTPSLADTELQPSGFEFRNLAGLSVFPSATILDRTLDVMFANEEEKFYNKDGQEGPSKYGLPAIKDALKGTTPEREGRFMNRVNGILSPFSAPQAAMLGPMVRTGTPKGTLLEELKQDVQESKDAFIKTVNPAYGDELVSYGTLLVQQELPNLHPTAQAAAGFVVDVATDPASLIGGFAAVVVARGMKTARALSGTDNIVGLFQAGVDDISDVLRGSAEVRANPEKFTEIGKLALKADKGDVKAMEKLNDKLASIPAVAKELQAKDKLSIDDQITYINEIIGSDKDAPFAISDGLGDGVSGLEPNVNINLATFDSIEAVDDLVTALSKRAESDLEKFSISSNTRNKYVEAANTSLKDILGKNMQEFSEPDAIAYKQALETVSRQLVIRARNAEAAAKNASKSGNTAGSALEETAYSQTLGIFNALIDKAKQAETQKSALLAVLKTTKTGDANRIKELHSILDSIGDSGVTRRALRKAIAQQTDPQVAARMAQNESRWRRLPGMYMEILVNSTISSLGTQATNIKSNVGVILMDPVLSAVSTANAAAKGVVYSMAGAGYNAKAIAAYERAAVDGADTLAQVGGILEGFSDVLQMSFGQSTWESLGLRQELRNTSELARQNIVHNITSEQLKLDGPLGHAIDYFGTAVRLPGSALLNADRGFKVVNYRVSINKQAARISRTAPGTPDDRRQLYNTLRTQPTDEMIKKSIHDSTVNTFTNALGDRAASFQQMVTKTHMAPFFLFFKVGTNIAKKGLKDGALGNAVLDYKNVAKGGAVGDRAQARIQLGTILPLTMVMTMDDRIVGSLDHTNPTDKFKIDSGVPPYSMRLPDKSDGTPDYWVYGKYEPLRAVLGLMANFKGAINSFEKINPETGEEAGILEEVFAKGMAPIMNTILDNYMLENVGGIVNLIKGIQKSDTTYFLKEAERLTSSVVFTNLVSNVNQTYWDDNFRYADTWLEGIKNRNWILSLQNSSQVTAWGDDRIRPSYVGVEYLTSTVSLGRDIDIWDTEITNVGVMLEDPPKSISADGVSLPLSGPQRTMFGRLRGKGIPGAPNNGAIKPRMVSMMSSPEYKDLARSERREVLNDLWSSQTSAVRDYLLENDIELREAFKEALFKKEMQLLKNRANPIPIGQRYDR